MELTDVAAATAQAGTEDQSRWVVETETVHIPESRSESTARRFALRTFDTLRRRVSRRAIGHEGAFAGFSLLDFPRVDLRCVDTAGHRGAQPCESSAPAKLQVSAVLVSLTERGSATTQRVAYEAAYVCDCAYPCRQNTVVAKGSGVTVGRLH